MIPETSFLSKILVCQRVPKKSAVLACLTKTLICWKNQLNGNRSWRTVEI